MQIVTSQHVSSSIQGLEIRLFLILFICVSYASIKKWCHFLSKPDSAWNWLPDMRNSKDQKPNAYKRGIRLAEIDEIWARSILPSLVQQQQWPQQLWNANTEGMLFFLIRLLAILSNTCWSLNSLANTAIWVVEDIIEFLVCVIRRSTEGETFRP